MPKRQVSALLLIATATDSRSASLDYRQHRVGEAWTDGAPRLVMRTSCPICGTRAVFVFQARHVPVNKCEQPSCGHLFASMSSPEQGVEEHRGIDEEHFAFAERNVRLINYLERVGVLRAEGRVLDFGSGAGHVAEAVKRLVGSSRITCVEADGDAAAALRSRGFETATRLDDVRGDYDAVLAIEVIEHLEDPVAMLAALIALMRPGGALFLTTPCGETRRGRHPASAYESPSHIQFFTERSLQLAVRLAGWDGIDLRVINAMYPHERGVRVLRSWIKAAGRAARARLGGPVHLTGTARVPGPTPVGGKDAVGSPRPAVLG